MVLVVVSMVSRATGDGAPAALTPDPTCPAELETFIEATMAELEVVPGLAIAVVQGDRVVCETGFGWADLEARIAAGSDTGFYIASSTKSFTGLAAAILAERGNLDLDAPFTDYIPVGIESQTPITVRDLLTHTSGLENDPVTFRTAYTGQHSRDVLITLLAESNVGSREFEYSNLGYVTASLVLDEITGISWKDVLQREIFEPLGMERTTAYVSATEGWEMAMPYMGGVGEPSRLPYLKHDDTMHAAGGTISTAHDLSRWLLANLNGGVIDGQRVFSEEVIRETHRAQAEVDEVFYRFHRLGYGLGWYVSDYDGDALLHHFGGFPGFRAHVSFMPEHGLGVAVVVNEQPLAFNVPDIIAAYVYDTWLEKPDVELRYREELERYGQQLSQFRERFQADLARRADRPKVPGRPLEAYAGTYASHAMGELVVTVEDDRLMASLGRLSAPMEPYDGEDALRVELVPGRGRVVRFHIGEDGRADSLTMEDHTWDRAKGRP